MSVQALLLANKTPVVGSIVVGNNSSTYGFSSSPFGSAGSISGDAQVVNSETVFDLTASASALRLITGVTANQALFRRMIVMDAAGNALSYFNSADATFVSNSPSGFSRWTWTAGADFWTSADVGETKRIGFEL